MMDLMYFGYDFEHDSCQLQGDFIREVKDKFPDVVLNDAYDSIKGYRQDVRLDKSREDEYYTFLIGKGWFEMSLTMQLVMMTNDRHDDFIRWFELAKEQYPKAFKPEALKEKNVEMEKKNDHNP
jgi:hypothetical protein